MQAGRVVRMIARGEERLEYECRDPECNQQQAAANHNSSLTGGTVVFDENILGIFIGAEEKSSLEISTKQPQSHSKSECVQGSQAFSFVSANEILRLLSSLQACEKDARKEQQACVEKTNGE